MNLLGVLVLVFLVFLVICADKLLEYMGDDEDKRK